MKVVNIIPFGPQHPVLPEPIHLDMQTEGEIVTDVKVVVGYVHRGIEKGLENDYEKNMFLAEKICGICSGVHTSTYSTVVESIMGIEVPKRAELIRAIILELERLHSHLLIIGLVGDAIGYENFFMQTWRDREIVMNLLGTLTGNRVHYGINKVGGVRRDLTDERIALIKKAMAELRPKVDDIADIVYHDYTLKKRGRGVGVLKKSDAIALGIVGPNARASGVNYDIRSTGYGAYKDLHFKPILGEAGDCHERTVVRVKELYQSMDLIEEALSLLEPGEIAVRPKGFPKGEAVARHEAPRGELFYYARGVGKKEMYRVKVRTPTYANIPGIPPLVKGMQIADVPYIVVSLDPCISCTER